MRLSGDDEELVRRVAEHFGQESGAMATMLLRLGAQQLAPGAAGARPGAPALAPTPTSTVPQQQSLITPPNRSELEWRVSEVWRCHLEQRRLYFEQRSGRVVSSQPRLDSDTKTWIIKRLREFDSHLMEPAMREQWSRESIPRAAGMGIFLDPFLTGENDQGREYLEHWRPWRKQRGKGDRIQEYADLYFEQRELAGM